MLENLQEAIRQNTKQTDLPEHVFVEAIEDALRAAARRVYGADATISVEIDLPENHIRCYVPKKVVNIMKDFSTEIPIEQARKLKPDAQLGQTLNVEINPSEFGRIPTQLAKQILFQKIKQAEREKVYHEFAGREGEIVTGYVQRYERGGIILDLERNQTEVFLPLHEIPRTRSYQRGKRLQCLILTVESEGRTTPITVSRTHRDLVTMLFEQEVPEIYEGQVQIIAVARDPGNRSKVAVHATEDGIDAVGTCVGVKGVRVQTVVNELDNEKIDLLEWSDDPTVFIENALRPATVRRVELNHQNQSAHVIVPDNQLSLAIGQRGQNARLAAKLTGWKIDITGEAEAALSIDTLFKEPDTTSQDQQHIDDENLTQADEETTKNAIELTPDTELNAETETPEPQEAPDNTDTLETDEAHETPSSADEIVSEPAQQTEPAEIADQDDDFDVEDRSM